MIPLSTLNTYAVDCFRQRSSSVTGMNRVFYPKKDCTNKS